MKNCGACLPTNKESNEAKVGEQTIAKRKVAEEESELVAIIFDLATDSIFVHDPNGDIVTFNDTACKKLGYSKEEMAKLKISDIDAPDFYSQIEPRVKLLLETGDAVFESVHACKDGTLRNVEVHARPVDFKGKRLVVSVVRDITERKKAEEALGRKAGGTANNN